MPVRKDPGDVQYRGKFGFLSFPAKTFAPAISKWIIPAIGISIGILAGCFGIEKIIRAVAMFYGVQE